MRSQQGIAERGIDENARVPERLGRSQSRCRQQPPYRRRPLHRLPWPSALRHPAWRDPYADKIVEQIRRCVPAVWCGMALSRKSLTVSHNRIGIAEGATSDAFTCPRFQARGMSSFRCAPLEADLAHVFEHLVIRHVCSHVAR